MARCSSQSITGINLIEIVPFGRKPGTDGLTIFSMTAGTRRVNRP